MSSSGTGVFKYQWAALFTTRRASPTAREDARPHSPDPGELPELRRQQLRRTSTPRSAQALAEVGTQGYPSQASISFLRSNSVASYMRDIRVPTLLGAGRRPTPCSTCRSRWRPTPRSSARARRSSLDWQSWGHSDSDAGRRASSTCATRAQSYQGRQALAWFDHYVRAPRPQPAAGLPLLPRLGLRRPRTTSPGLRDGAVLPGRHRSGRCTCPAASTPRHSDGAPGRPAEPRWSPGHERLQQLVARSARTTPRRRGRRPDQQPVTDPPGGRDPVRDAAADPAGGRRGLAPADRAAGRAGVALTQAGGPAGQLVRLRQALRRRARRRRSSCRTG